MTPVELSRTVLSTVRRAVEAGELRVPVPPSVLIERPPRPGIADYATNIALQLAGPAARPPRDVAEILRSRIAAEPGIAGVAIAGPGFLNIRLDAGSPHDVHDVARDIVRQGSSYGHGDALARDAVELRLRAETRAAVTADALARLLCAQGATVRLHCTGTPDPAWSGLGVRLDAGGTVIPSDVVTVRPVPASSPPVEGADGSSHATAGSLLERFGSDAVRWALLRPAAHDRPRLTGGLLVQRESNPLFRVRYAHARCSALVRNAADLGCGPAGGDPATPARDDHPAPDDHPDVTDHPGRPTTDHLPGATGLPGGTRHPRATDHPGDAATARLVAVLTEHPRVLEAAARHRAPDRVARHLELVADAFFRFHDTCSVLPRGGEKPRAAHRDRVALAQASGTVLAGGLHLLGITAPVFL